MSEQEFNRYSKSTQKLNTQGCCFLCFKFKDFGENEINGDDVRKSFSIQTLLRHLQIHPESIIGNTFDSFHRPARKIEADLCDPCGNKIEKFSILFLQLEKVEMELKYLLEEIHQRISQSSKDTDLVQNYSKRMTSGPKALAQLAYVDNLRRELSKQSLNKHGNLRRPSINLKRIKVPLKQVLKVEAEEMEGLFIDNLVCKIGDPGNSNQLFNDCLAQSVPPCSPGSSSHLGDFKIPQTFSSQESLAQGSTSTTHKRSSKYFRKDSVTGLFQCKRCGKTFTNSNNIARHFKTVHLGERVKCDICNVASFKQFTHLKIHKKSCLRELAKQSDPNYKFVCKFCTKRFENRGKLSRHVLAVHTNVNRYPCNLCEKKFTTFASMKNHRDAIHLGKTYSCMFCSKEYRSSKYLRLHKKMCVQSNEIKIETKDKLA